MALASTMHLSAALADEGAAGDSPVAAEGVTPEAGQGDAGDANGNGGTSTPTGEADGAAAGEGSSDATAGTADGTAPNADGTVTGSAPSAASDSATSNPDAGVSPAAAGDTVDTVVDGNTLTGWAEHLTPGSASTQNIGRIWTDKTVLDGDASLTGDGAFSVAKGNSDFLVGLSALSSMSTITNEVTKPLDIVLVLDVSGSMNDPMGTPQYSQVAANSVSTNSTDKYWINDNGTYREVYYHSTGAWWCQDNQTWYWPYNRNGRPDWGSATPTYTTFYQVTNSKMSALQEAVNGFIDTTAQENDDIADNDLKHRISVVKFANNQSTTVGNNTYTDPSDGSTVNYSQTVSNLAAYDSSNANNLKNRVNALVAAGSTRADYGMTLAANQLDQRARTDAQKVVIFFTDGEPNNGSGFVDDIANAAIQQASALNAKDTLTYTIGVFDGANPDETSPDASASGKFNAYMNAMSSKYPYAQSFDNLGSPAGTRDYYRAAENADQLSQIFTDIAGELQTETSESPVAASGGAEGTLTFTDQLGEYMEVDSFKSIVYANKQFTPVRTEKVDENTTRYVFEGEVSDPDGIFTEGNMANIEVRVTKSATLAEGDTVTVTIPASLLPLRNYQASVDKDDNVTWDGVSAAYPIRAFYGVSLKDDAAKAIKDASADAALQSYIENHTVEQGGKKTVSFLSNLYNGGEDGATISSFSPAKNNAYYYVQENTPLYMDEACTRPLTEDNWNRYGNEETSILYYKETFYQENVGKAQEVVSFFPVSTFAEGVTDGFIINTGSSDGSYYLAAGAPRLSHIRDLHDAKAKNNTSTASNTADPQWNVKAFNASTINTKLGNNGKLFVELPGELHVSKTVTVDDGLDKTQFTEGDNAKSFNFTVHVDGMANQTVKAQVVRTNGGAVVSSTFDFPLDGNGSRSQSLKDGETLIITGLNDGASYTVTESLPQGEGWTNSEKSGDTGTISSTTPAQASFTNNYTVEPIDLTDGIQAQKTFTNLDTNTPMDWDGATFDFVLEAVGGGTDGSGSRDVNNNPVAVADVPMPGGSDAGVKHQTVANADAFGFGAIEYAKPGTYVYHVSEESPSKDDSDWRAGVDYSSAVYHAIVVVVDNGDGTLSIDQNASDMYMEVDDDSADVHVDADVANITNTFQSTVQNTNFLATKNWTDNSGSRPALGDNQFRFVLEAVSGTHGGNAVDITDIPMPANAGGAIVGHIGSSVAWGSVPFTNAMDGDHYIYKLYEQQPTTNGKLDGSPLDAGMPSEAKMVDGHWVYRGVTYDNEVYTAEVEVGVDEADDGTQTTWTHITYKNAAGETVVQSDGSATAERIPFSNSYDVNPTPAHDALQVRKTMDGRNLANGETFVFTLEQTAGPTDGATGLAATATVTGDGNDKVGVATFGQPTFTKAGTYTFKIHENGTDGNGLTYDTHDAYVTYVVNDTSADGTVLHTGNLRVASRTFDNSDGLTEADRGQADLAAFTNTYRATQTFGGITVSKTLTGRAMGANEFDFTIEALDAAGHDVPAGDAAFSTVTGAAAGTAERMRGKLSSLTFTQADAGDTFTYIIDEVEPADGDADKLAGVTYDDTRYKLTIAVTDNGNGTLDLEHTIVPVDENNDATGAAVTVAAFTNRYVPAPSDPVTPELNKVFSGRSWTANDTFAFDIEKVSYDGRTSGADFDAMPMPKNANGDTVTSVTLNGDGNLAGTASGTSVAFGFGGLTFAKAGTYVYSVSEQHPADATETDTGWVKDGITYTKDVALISVTVDDRGTGKLEARTPMISFGTFNNYYNASEYFDSAVDFQLTKTLSGHSMAANQFRFNVTALDGTGTTAAQTAAKIGLTGGATTIPVPGKAGDEDETVTMMDGAQQLSFNQADSGKTFVIQFDEVQGTQGGYTYDKSVYQMFVTPTDNGDGTMTIHTVIKRMQNATGATDGKTVFDSTWNQGDPATASLDFVNSYASEGTLALSGTKTVNATKSEYTGGLSGFQFKIEQVDASNNVIGSASTVTLPEVATSDGNGNFTFDNVTFTEAGTYRFKVSEVVPADADKAAGVQYNAAPIYLDVTVTENDADGYGDGQLNVAVTRDGQAFDPATALGFTNIYETTDAAFTPSVTKKVTGLDATQHFTFEMVAADDATKTAIDTNVIQNSGMTKDNGYKATASTGVEGDAFMAKGAEKTVDFSKLTFTKTGTYTFQVTEAGANSSPEGWTYDGHTYTLKIVVSDDDNDAKLTAQASPEGVDQAQQSSTFTNSFGATTTYSAQGGLQVTKTLNGRALEAGKFNFTITANDNDSQAKLDALGDAKADTIAFSNPEGAMGTPVAMDKLGSLEFTEADIDKTYTYTVTEVKPDDAETSMPGYTYDGTPSATVTIEVKQANGKIYTVTTVTKGDSTETYNSQNASATAVVPFVNSYAATGELDGSLNLAGTKALRDSENNNVPLNGRQWTFTLEGANDATNAAIADSTVTLPTSSAIQNTDGTFAFGNITFKSTGATTVDYTFKVTESGAVPGVTNDTNSERTIVVRVTDNGDSTLTPEVVSNQSENLAFVNTYGANSDTQVEIKGTKTLDANGYDVTPNIKEQYTFTLAAAEGMQLVGGDNFANNVKNTNENGTGTVSFGNLKFTMADLDGADYVDGVRSKTFTYTVTEAGEVPGVTNDTNNPKTITVKLTDDGKGTLTATVENATDGNAFAFTNTYAPGSATNAPANVKKVLTGDRGVALQDQEFGFEMSVAPKAGTDTPEDGFTMPADATAKNDANGDVKFGDITFTKPGTYTVTVKEQVPADDDKAPYMTYDGHTYTYDVVVSADGSGNLKAEAQNFSTADGGSTFTNTYTTPKQEKDVFNASAADPTTSVDGKMVGVGDVLTYKVTWANDALDAQGKSVAANVVVTDVLPQGTELITMDSGELNVPEGADYDEATRTLTWNLGQQAAGATGTVEFEVVVTDAAVNYDDINNTATIVIGDNSKSTDTTHNTIPKKTVDGKPEVEGDVQVGSELTYTIGWANTTGETANVKVTDVLSEGLTFVAAEGGAYDEATRTVTWNLGNKDNGTSGTVSVTVRVNENAVKVDADNSNKATIQVGNDSSYTTNTVPDFGPQTGSLTISKTVVGEDAPEGQSFTFTLTGSAADTNLSGTYNYTGTNGKADGTVTFTNGQATVKLTAGQSITISGLPVGATVQAKETPVTGFTVSANPLSATIDADDSTTQELAFTNTYGGNENTKDVTNNSAEDQKASVNGKLVGVGDTLTYTINWKNDAVDENGVATKANVTVTDVVPQGTTLVAGSISNNGSESNGTITWNLDEQEASASGTVSFQVKVDESAVTYDSIKNTASITVGENEPKSTNETETFVPKKEETTNPDSIEVGQTLEYSISFKNTDGEGATATVVDTLSEGLTFEGTSNVKVNGEDWDSLELNVGDSTLTWTINSLPANADVVITFKATITRDALSSVNNGAKVNGHESNVVTTPVPTDNAKHVKDTDGAVIDGKLVGVGETLEYVIDWANESTNETGDVTIVDTLPTGVTLVDGTITDGGTYSANEHTITWNLTGKQPGERGSVSFKVTVDNDAATAGEVADLVNTATVNGNEVTVTNSVPGKKAESAEGSGTTVGDIYVGKELTYTIAYKNTEATAADITITDSVPAGTEFVKFNGDTADKGVNTNGALTWTLEGVEPNTAGTVSFTVRVTEAAVSATNPVTNQATITIGDRESKTNTTTNQVSKGALAIYKTVDAGTTGADIDTNQTFEFTITLTAPDGTPITGTYGYDYSDGTQGTFDFDDVTGKAEISLKHGQSIMINGLPADVRYSVEEASVAGYSSTSEGASGTVPAGKRADARFTNTFTPTSAEHTPEVTKVLAGFSKTGLVEGAYTFRMSVAPKAGTGTPDNGFSYTKDAEGNDFTTASNAAPAEGENSATVTFAPITFTKVGTYEVTITEAIPGEGTPAYDATVTYDKHSYTYEVTVTAQDGKLVATPSAQPDDEDAKFTNEIKTGSLSISKKVTADAGLTAPAGKSFTFEVAAKGPDGAALSGEYASVTKLADGTETPGTVTFTPDGVATITLQADETLTIQNLPAGTVYAARETNLPDGFTLSTIDGKTVLKNAEGTIESNVTTAHTFANNYSVIPGTLVGENDLAGVKTVAGGVWSGDLPEFQFTLVQVDRDGNELAEPDPNVTLPDALAKSDKDGAFHFGDIVFKMPGDYYFQITETDEGKAGWIYDDKIVNIKVSVTNNGDGTLAVAKVATASDAIEFENTYNAEGTFNLTGTKALNGRALKADEFGFAVLPSNVDAQNPTEVDFLATATNDADGNVVFSPIYYSAQALNEVAATEGSNVTKNADGTWTVSYNVIELTGEMPAGVTADASVFRYAVVVSDNHDGTLSVAPAEGIVAPAFVNTYGKDATASATIAGVKTLDTNGFTDVLDIAGKYTFSLTAEDGAPLNKAEGFKDEPTNQAPAEGSNSGSVVFGDLMYTMADLADVEPGENGVRSKQFTYTVNETGSVDGVTNDVEPKKVTVTLTDNGSGELSAEATGFEFVNKYTPSDITNTPVDVVKRLEGNRTEPLKAGEFTFEMSVAPKADTNTPADGFTMPDGGTAPVTTTNAAPVEGGEANQGAVTFGNITFTKAGIYTVTVREVVPAEGSGEPFMTYDDHSYSYDVEVTSGGSKLVANVIGTSVSGSPVFTNTYTSQDNTKDVVKTDAPETTINGQLVGVGDQLTYKINWVNNAVDPETGKAIAAKVTITDTVPAGTKLIRINDEGTQDESGMITWSIEAAAGQTGTVSFDVVVDESAATPVDEITNKATINVGGHDYNVEVKNDFPKKTVEQPSEDGVQVGDVLTYTIQWANTTGETADVVVTDAFMNGLQPFADHEQVVVEGAENYQVTALGGTDDGTVVTVTIGEVPAGSSGTVTIKAQVTDKALVVDELTNKATIKVGDNSEVITNTVPGPELKTGDLSITKNVALYDENTPAPEGQEFEFTVELKDKASQALAGTYDVDINYNGETTETAQVTNGGTLKLKAGGTAVIKGLPEGASYRVSETPLANFRTSYDAGEGDTSTGTIAANETSAVVVTNTYAPSHGILPGPQNLKVSKTLEGRGWQPNEQYTFQITASDVSPEDTPMPEVTEIVATADNPSPSFGDIQYSKAGTYTYLITETGKSGDANLTYSTAQYEVVVSVWGTDDNGALRVSSIMTKVLGTGSDAEQVGEEQVDGHTEWTANFINVYTPVEQPEKDVLGTDENGEPTTSINGQLVGAGDTLTYTVEWANDAIDDAGNAAAAKVVVTDAAPEGTEYVHGSAKFVGAEAGAEGYSVSVADDGTITWTIENAAANASGMVSFQVKVTDDAVNNDPITNTATIKVGDNDPKTSTETTNDFPKKTVDGRPEVEGEIKVGDELVYTIEWANTTGAAANVTVTDVLPAGLTFLEASDGGVLGENNTVTWSLGEQPDGANGTVSVRVAVNDAALTSTIDNQATLNIGDNPAISTNTVPGPEVTPANGKLVIGKQVTIEDGQGIDEAQARGKDFKFEVSVTSATGETVTGEFPYVGQGGAADGELELAATSGKGTVTLKDGQSVEISGLPSGSTWTVTEIEVPDGYTTRVDSGANSPEEAGEMVEGTTLTGTIAGGQALATAFFENHYAVTPTTLEGATNLVVTKDLQGRDWTENDAFSFALSANENDEATKAAVDAGNIVLPENASDIAIDSTMPEHKAAFDDITFKQAGTFQFYVTELLPEGATPENGYTLDGITYDATQRLVTVNVKDNGDGTLTAGIGSITVPGEQEGELADASLTFTNIYKTGETTVDTNPTDTSALFTKSFMGKSWGTELFNFQIVPQDGAPAFASGETTVDAGSPTVEADDAVDPGMDAGNADAGETKMFGFGTVTFGDANMRDAEGNRVFEKTFTYDVSEIIPEGAAKAEGLPDGYKTLGDITYDGHHATLSITVTDDGKGNLTASEPVITGGANWSNLFESGQVDFGDAVNVQIAKTLTGRDMTEGETFSFVATASDAASADRLGLSESGTTYHTSAALDGETATTPLFEGLVTDVEGNPVSGIVFTQEDVGASYSFTVSEVDDAKGGVTYDGTTYTVTIAVGQNEAGQLVVTTTVAGSNGETQTYTHTQGDADGATPTLTFANTYSAKGQLGGESNVSLDATKALVGRPMADGEFSFVVTNAADGSMVATGSNAAAESGVSAAIDFSTIVYTTETLKADAQNGLAAQGTSAEGFVTYTYTYRVYETTAALGAAGITPTFPVDENGAATYYEVTVTVTDNGKGALTPSVAYPEGMSSLPFENRYGSAEPETTAIVGAKTVVGLPEGTFLQAGEYSFFVRPLTDGDPNAAGATTLFADGTTNTGTFSFPLAYEMDDLNASDATTSDNGDGTVTRTKTFTYEVSEINNGTFGVRYDETVFYVDVVVTDDGHGSLVAEVQPAYTADGAQFDQPSFTNVFGEDITFTPQGEKWTEAADGVNLDGKRFTFSVTDWETGQVVSTGLSDARGVITFTPITLRGEGTFYYTISEVWSGAANPENGIGYDTTTYTLELTVTRDGNGTYDYQASYRDDTTGELVAAPYFTNTYNLKGTSINFSATKEINDPHSKAGFRFDVVDDATGQVVTSGVSDASGNVTFGSIFYTYDATASVLPDVLNQTADAASMALANAGFIPTVVTGDAAPTPEQAGVVYRVMADGADIAAGTAIATNSSVEVYVYGPYVEPAAAPENSAAADDATTEPVEPIEPADPVTPDVPADTTDPAEGATENTDIPAAEPTPDETVVSEEEGVEPEALSEETVADETVLDVAADLLAPTVAIADDQGAEPYAIEPVDPGMQLISSDLGEHHYTIYEVNDGQDGVTYDGALYHVTVNVTDAGNGTMAAAITRIERTGTDGSMSEITLEGADGMANVVFTNTYKAIYPAKVTLEGTKTLMGRDAADGEFTFSVLDANGNVVAGGMSLAAQNGQPGAIRFGSFSIAEPGDYVFTVVENNAGSTLAGVTYDRMAYTVNIHVVDNGDGTLSASVASILDADGFDVTAEGMEFVNTYKATQGTSVTLEGTKTLTGRDMADGEFAFVATGADGQIWATASSKAASDGQPAGFTFTPITFAEPGEYDFVLSEVHAGETIDGVTYSDVSFTVHVSVVDNLDGTLSATVSYPEGGVAFTNAYKPTAGDAAQVTPVATKSLTGRDLKGGDFTFALTDAATGQVVSTATNAADGSISFPALRFEAEGEYGYVISEVAGREEGMTYDASTYRIQVSVADDGKGNLVATAGYPDGPATFSNSYEKPEEPEPPTPDEPDTSVTPGGDEPNKPSIPKTGDATGPMAFVSAIMGAIVLTGAGVLVRRKTREQQ